MADLDTYGRIFAHFPSGEVALLAPNKKDEISASVERLASQSACGGAATSKRTS
jgi:hypothetical protein